MKLEELIQTLKIDEEYQELINNRTILVNKVLDKMTDWDKFFEYYQILINLLPVGRWYHEMPTSLKKYIENVVYNDEKLLYYDIICEHMLDDNENIDLLLNEVKNYIRNHMICGTCNDW